MDIYAAGALAAFTVDVLVYPLDTLKTRYQSQDYLSTYGTSSKALSPRGLYQGIGSVVLATLPAAGIFFSTYEKAKDVMATLPVHQSLVHACASATAEMAACLVLAPAEVIKQNAQMLRGDAAGSRTSTSTSTSLEAWRRLAARGAPRRLFSGYTALVARNLPFTALQFPVFEHLRSWAWERRMSGREGSGSGSGRDGDRGTGTGSSRDRDRHRVRGSQRGVLETGLVAGGSAGCAGAAAAWVTTPGDVVKTRMMLMAGGSEGGTSAWAVAGQVWRERGLVGFFRGGLFRSGWTALGSCLYLGTYDGAKVWLRRRKGEDVDGDGDGVL